MFMNVMMNRLFLQEILALLALRGKAFQPGENFRENVCTNFHQNLDFESKCILTV